MEKKITAKKNTSTKKKNIPKKNTPAKKKSIPAKKKSIPKKIPKIIIEKESNVESEVITDEKYSEKLELVINKIKSQTLGESENKIRFGWK